MTHAGPPTDGIHAGGRVVIVDRTDGAPAAHGLARLEAALDSAGTDAERVDHWTATDRGTVLVAGTTDGGPVERLLADAAVAVPDRPESLVYAWRPTASADGTDGGHALVVGGTDGRGLLYGLLELAERVVADGAAALAAIEPTVEAPDNRVRGVDRFLEGPVEDEWFYDDAFWEYYLERLARCRFNRFVLVTGYDTAFMSPPYPFLVDVPGFDARLTGDVPDRRTHREQIRRIGELCDRYGLEFFFGIWQQRPWTDYQGRLVEGLPEGSAYADYCAAGLRELLTACPGIDGVQLRVNYESGVAGDDDRATAEAFWFRVVDAVAAASEARGTGTGATGEDAVALDLRAKGLTDATIDHGLERGLDVTVPTKFWCESTGLPYHNSRMREGELANLDDRNRSRRYSYADLLERPRAYDVSYRLWVVGTNRILVWGDPDYARRFSAAAGFGDATGFEVTAPLSLKGGHYGLQDDRWPLFDDPDLRDYEYEDERYWAWYRLFGRLGYSAATAPDVWERAFDRRFGAAADAVERAYRAASKVLPLVTAAHLTAHPALHNWAELDTGGALFAEHNHNETFGETTYASAEPSDPGLFYGIDEYVADRLAGDRAGKYAPDRVAGWLAGLAAETRSALDAAAADAPDTGEYRATELDLGLLVDLADYHARKTHAALALERYREAGDPDHLPDAHAAAVAARAAWADLAERGRDSYHDDLVFGTGPPVGDAGTWADRLGELDADVDRLETLLEANGLARADGDRTGFELPAPSGLGASPLPTYGLDVPDRHPAGDPLDVRLDAGALERPDRVRLRYRRANQLEGAFRSVAMERVDGDYRATVPADYLSPAFDLLVYATVVDGDEAAVVPGLYHSESPMPYRVVGVTDGDGPLDGGGRTD